MADISKDDILSENIFFFQLKSSYFWNLYKGGPLLIFLQLFNFLQLEDLRQRCLKIQLLTNKLYTLFVSELDSAALLN